MWHFTTDGDLHGLFLCPKLYVPKNHVFSFSATHESEEQRNPGLARVLSSYQAVDDEMLASARKNLSVFHFLFEHRRPQFGVVHLFPLPTHIHAHVKGWYHKMS